MGFRRGSKSSREKKKAEQQAKELLAKHGVCQWNGVGPCPDCGKPSPESLQDMMRVSHQSEKNRLFAEIYGGTVPVSSAEQRVADILRERDRKKWAYDQAKQERAQRRQSLRQERKAQRTAQHRAKVARNEQRKQPQTTRERDPRLAVPGGIRVLGENEHGRIIQHLGPLPPERPKYVPVISLEKAIVGAVAMTAMTQAIKAKKRREATIVVIQDGQVSFSG